MNRFLELRTERKVIFFISIAKRCLTLINDTQQAHIAANALECCWKQIIEKNMTAKFYTIILITKKMG